MRFWNLQFSVCKHRKLMYCCCFLCRLCNCCNEAQETAAQGAVFARAGVRTGATLHGAEVPHSPRARAARHHAAPDGNSGEDLVPEQTLQKQEAADGAGQALPQELQGPQGLLTACWFISTWGLQATELPSGYCTPLRPQSRVPPNHPPHPRTRLHTRWLPPSLPSLTHETQLSSPLELPLLPSLCNCIPCLLSSWTEFSISLSAISPLSSSHTQSPC